MRNAHGLKIASWLVAATGFSVLSSANENGKVQVLTEWPYSDGPLRVDCREIPITGGGFGGAIQSCEERLSLFALFNCYPMKKEHLEAYCPAWEGLDADIDWETVSDLIDARREEIERKRHELQRQSEEYQQREADDP